MTSLTAKTETISYKAAAVTIRFTEIAEKMSIYLKEETDKIPYTQTVTISLNLRPDSPKTI